MVIERDFRKLALATQAELRRIAVAMVRAGKTRIEAAEVVGVNRRFVGQWVKAAAQSGEAALAGRPRGRRPGEQKALGAMQEARLRDLIARGCPDQFGLWFALWTRPAVRALIARDQGLADPVGSWPLSAGLGLYRPTADAPGQRAAGRGVRAWLENTYPAIALRAKAQGCEIQGPTRPGFPIRPTAAAALLPEGRPRSSGDRPGASRSR
jgi:transposase